jgi:hypothetical protein
MQILSETTQPTKATLIPAVDAFKYTHIKGHIQKFPDSVNNEIYAYNNKHSLRSNTKGYGSKTH